MIKPRVSVIGLLAHQVDKTRERFPDLTIVHVPKSHVCFTSIPKNVALHICMAKFISHKHMIFDHAERRVICRGGLTALWRILESVRKERE